MLFSAQPNLPNILHRMPSGDKTLIFRDHEQFFEILEHASLWIALAKIPKQLSANRADVIVTSMVSGKIKNTLASLSERAAGLE